MDEEDEFLYGPSDDKKELEVSKQEESNDDNVNILNTEKDNTSGEESSDSKNDKKQESSSEKEELDSDVEKEREHETDMLEDSSDSDVEFVIGPLASTSTNTETPGVVSKEAGEEGEEDTEAGKDTNGNNASTNIHTVPVLKETHGLDINEVGKYDGVPVTELTLDELKDKPWRQPGADLSDYFNYGFDEISWLTYCKKQNTLRKDFNPAKVMAEIMSSGAMAGMMPGPIPGPNGNNSGGPPPFMMGPMGMPPFMNGMPSGMQMPGMYGQNGGNGNNNGNTNANNDRINSSAMNNNSNSNSMMNQNNSGRSSLPHLPRLPSRPPASSNSPEPSMGRQQGGMNSSNYRERSDRALDMRSGRKSGQNYRDRSGRRH